MSKADAFWFGPPTRRAFGWYHAPSEPGRALGVVLCPPLGHEMLCSHRAYRHLAQGLAERGFPVLRFDYHGTGDSTGTDYDEDRVGAWLATIDDAIKTLRSTGVSRIALVGTRVGATFAAMVAARRGDIEALALVAPSMTGTAFLREIRAMHKVRDRGERRPNFRDQREGDEEAIGFVFRRETIEALGKADLRALEKSPAPHVLIVPRDDLPGAEARIAERLRTLGAEVDVVKAAGYAGLAADDPYVAEVPVEIWSAVASWLVQRAPASETASPVQGAPNTSAEHVDERVTETAIRFGPEDRFFAILAEPRTARSDVAIVIPNTGANSRVGTNRFGVAVARRLAARGHAVMRIDLGGIGDSPPHEGAPENDLFATRSIDDVRAAIDALAGRGYRRFVTMGLCAGAYMSFHASLTDERVVGVVLMNPPAFEWTPGRKVERIASKRGGGFRSTRYYKTRAFRFDTWKRVLRGEVNAKGIARVLGERLRVRAAGAVKRAALVVGHGEWVMSDLAQKFASLIKRNTRVLLLFNGEEPMVDEIDRHLGSLMSFLEARGLEMEIIDDTDHVFAPVWSQERAADVLTDFIDRVAQESSR